MPLSGVREGRVYRDGRDGTVTPWESRTENLFVTGTRNLAILSQQLLYPLVETCLEP